MRGRPTPWLTTTAVAVAALSAPAWAQTADEPLPSHRVAAEALFQEGRALLVDGKATAACPKLEESQRLDPATGTLLAVALCHEQIGKLASAWAAFADVEGRSRLDGRVDRERIAHEHGAALRPRLSTLTLRIATAAAAAPGLVIALDGVAIGRGAFGVAIPVDGGSHGVEASAPGQRTWTAAISVGPEGDHATVDVPPLADDRTGARAAPPLAPPAVGTGTGAGGERAGHAGGGAGERTGGGARVAALVLAGTGVLALGAGAVVALDARRDYVAAKADCDATGCMPGPYARVQDARARGNWATLIAVAGGVAVVSAAAVWLMARPAAPAERRGVAARGPRLEQVGLAPQGVIIGGRF
jgi:hypothetical protein